MYEKARDIRIAYDIEYSQMKYRDILPQVRSRIEEKKKKECARKCIFSESRSFVFVKFISSYRKA